MPPHLVGWGLCLLFCECSIQLLHDTLGDHICPELLYIDALPICLHYYCPILDLIYVYTPDDLADRFDLAICIRRCVQGDEASS